MKKISEAQGAAIARAYQDMAAGKIVVVTTPEGTRAQVMRIVCGVDIVSGTIEDFDRFDSFDSFEEAKAFLKGELFDDDDGESTEARAA
jgi:hypothetical protein